AGLEGEGAERSATRSWICRDAAEADVRPHFQRMLTAHDGKVIGELLRDLRGAGAAAGIADALKSRDRNVGQATDRQRPVESREDGGWIKLGVLANAEARVIEVRVSRFIKNVGTDGPVVAD